MADDFQKEARIPGFRPGHAPRTVVVKKFHKDIESEAQRTLVPEAYQEAITEKKLRVVSQPEIEDLKYQAGLSLSFSTVVELVPDFKLPDYKGLVLKKQETEVTDEDVEKTLKSLADQRANFEDAPDRPLAMDDFAVISYTGKLDGKPLIELVPDAKNLAHNPQLLALDAHGRFSAEVRRAMRRHEEGRDAHGRGRISRRFPAGRAGRARRRSTRSSSRKSRSRTRRRSTTPSRRKSPR